MASHTSSQYHHRAIIINGRRTNIALEPAFWSKAESIAAASGITANRWVASRLEQLNGDNRTSAIRVAILEAD